MYLSREAIAITLAALASLAAPDSLLLATYFTTPAPAFALLTTLARPLFAGIGEPLKTRLAPDEAAALFAEHGFVCEKDEGDDDWSARWASRPARIVMAERLLVARLL